MFARIPSALFKHAIQAYEGVIELILISFSGSVNLAQPFLAVKLLNFSVLTDLSF